MTAITFAFDLDGTITAGELLPLIAARAGLERETAELTRRTLSGEIPFAESFRRRFGMLRTIPVDVVQATVSSMPLNEDIEAFIRRRRNDCAVVTGNLDVWTAPLRERLGCRFFCSRSRFGPNGLELVSVLEKGAAVREMAREGRRVIAVGESVGDLPMFAEAACGVAFAGVHEPVPAISAAACRRAENGAELCGILEELERGCLAPSHIGEKTGF